MCTVKGFNDSPPPLGSTITIKHNGAYSTGTLKNPVYWRDSPTPQSANQKVKFGVHLLHEAPNWTIRSNHAEFFDRLAQVKQVSQPADWCRVKKEDVYNLGGQKLLQRYYNDSLYKVTNTR